MTEQDTKPWYRQFWPWFLIALPGSAVVASLYTVSLAVRTTDSLVVTSEDGMEIVTQRHLAAEAVARNLGIRAQINIDVESGAVVATLVAESAVDWPKTMILLFSHPAFADRDQSVTLTAAIPDSEGNPTFSGHFVDVPSGRFYVVLKDGDNWRLTGSWSGASRIHLAPAGSASDGSI